LKTPSRLAFLALSVTLIVPARPLSAQTLGSITFPTSANPAAQAHFLEGVKDLHSFAFDEAAVAFRDAQKSDPNFALAYWGEAMSHNHPLWAQQDLPAAQAVLLRLAPTADQRFAKAGTPKERAYLEAQEKLFNAPGDKLARDIAYSDAMAQMHARWPDDDEIAIFYCLSLLGTVRPADTGYRRQAMAASIALDVFARNPDHPGAAHFIIHAFDDPDLAILALPAARRYAKIAPDAPHALHMPSHIFVQLGMWQDVRTSNTAAYASALGVVQRLHVPEGREDFHTLSWLQYANLMLGNFDEAAQNLAAAHAALQRNPGNNAIRQGYLNMWARQVLETQQWANLPLSPEGRKPTAPWLFIVGFSAAHKQNFDLAKQAAHALSDMDEAAKKDESLYSATPILIMQKEVDAEIEMQQGHPDAAIALAKQASTLELTLHAPSGPPEPIKPAPEYYAEILARTGQKSLAASAFQQELTRTPNRTPSVAGLKATGVTSASVFNTSKPNPDTPHESHVH
jgi:tetratricopeptide (TPR) repeat protein